MLLLSFQSRPALPMFPSHLANCQHLVKEKIHVSSLGKLYQSVNLTFSTDVIATIRVFLESLTPQLRLTVLHYYSGHTFSYSPLLKRSLNHTYCAFAITFSG